MPANTHRSAAALARRSNLRRLPDRSADAVEFFHPLRFRGVLVMVAYPIEPIYKCRLTDLRVRQSDTTLGDLDGGFNRRIYQ